MNILMIVCDTLRADHLGCYSYFRETSPNIDSLAQDGIVFEDFYNSGAPTGPGFTCIYTGLHTIHHKYYRFLTPNIRQVDDTIFTIPEVLRAAGYTTAAFDNLFDMTSKGKHFVRGYEFYINCGASAFDMQWHWLMAEQVNSRLIPWIRKYSHHEFFLFVHYWDPHLPYNQPEEYKSLFHHEKGNLSDLKVAEAPAGYQYVPGWGKVGDFADGEVAAPYGPNPTVSIDLYDGEIAYMDNAIGEVLKALEDERVLDDTMVIVTSDHGEQLGQHRNYGWEHEGLHDAVTHIPLIMSHPKNLPKGLRVKGFCQHIDLLPTILDLIGAQAEVLEIDGESIISLLKNEKIRDRIFMESSSGKRAIRTDEWKLLADEWALRPHRETELYNLKEDPMEVINLAETEKDECRELREALFGWVRANLKEGELDPAVIEDEKGHNIKALEYRYKISRLLESLRKERSEKMRCQSIL